MRMPLFVTLALTLLPTGCIHPYECLSQVRFLDAYAASSTPAGDSLSATLTFTEFKGGENQRSLTWTIRSSVDTARISAVHIRRGSAGEVGEVLFSFQNGYAGPGDVITQSSPQIWTGSVDYEELFDLIRAGAAYIDVQTTDPSGNALRAQLRATSDVGWQDACT